MIRKATLSLHISLLLLLIVPVWGQKKSATKKDAKLPAVQKENAEVKYDESVFSSLAFRSIGPAVTSGRISDFAVIPGQASSYYVATSSGGVWKTTNRGTTWQSVFDNEGSYSIGCVSLEPGNPSTIWVGTGENNNQRSVGYGDGVYKSTDSGKSWKNMGLKHSEHIAKVVIDPNNAATVYVAAYGPLWKEGGEEECIKQQTEGQAGRA